MTLIVLTGIQAAGKSTVAQALAETSPRSVHVRGDTFRRMIVNGRAPSAADPDGEAVRQLHLRYRLAAAAATTYARDGFTTVLQDTILGPHLGLFLGLITYRPLHLVVLAPDAETVMERDAGRRAARGKVAYHPGRLEVSQLDRILRTQTPRLGHWLDTSHLSVDETVDAILANLDAAAIP